MQQMMIMAEGTDNMNLLETFDSFNNLWLPLIPWIGEESKSHLMSGASKRYRRFLEEDGSSLHNHMMGLSPKTFQKFGLDDFYRIVHISHDRKGQAFISTIEAREYPFYGVQWHPERDPQMNYFAQFFADEIKKNQKIVKKSNDPLHSMIINCMNFSDNIYHDCHFYWHKIDSTHNPKLCNILHLGLPANGGV